MSAAASRRHGRTEAALAALRHDLAGGAYRGSDMLPGERDLAARLAVSRTTVRRLLADLVDEGLLRHRQGVGTFVGRGGAGAASAERHGGAPARLPGFAEDLAARGLCSTTRELLRTVTLPSAEEAMMLGCSAAAPVVRLVRLRFLGGTALALERAAIPASLLPDLAGLGASLYAALAAAGAAPLRALDRTQAVELDAEAAAALGVAPGSAGLRRSRTAYRAGGACCDYTVSLSPGGRYDLLSETVLACGGS